MSGWRGGMPTISVFQKLRECSFLPSLEEAAQEFAESEPDPLLVKANFVHAFFGHCRLSIDQSKPVVDSATVMQQLAAAESLNDEMDGLESHQRQQRQKDPSPGRTPKDQGHKRFKQGTMRHVDLLNLQGSMACYDSILSDLEGQQRLAAEDAVIHVKIKRRRSPSPQSSRKRRNGGEQSTDIVSSQALRIPRNQYCRDDMFRGLLAMSYGQINRPDAITQPREGELYFAYRKQSQRWLVALLLPLAGASAWGTLGSLGFLKSLPEPLTFDPDTQQLKWRDGYEDGGPLSSKQEFPVAFFAGPNFPGKSAVGWVTAEELCVLNESCLNPSVIPHWRAVRTFLERRAVSCALQDRIGLSPSLSDTYTDGSNGPIEHGQDAFLTSEATATKSSTIGSEDRPQLISREIWPSLHPLPSNLNTAQAHSPIAVGHANASPEPVLPENYYLPRIDGKKREIHPPSLPRLRDIHMNVPGTLFGLFEWPVAVPQRILDLLAKKSEFAGIKPLPKDFSNSRGLFCCPLCPKIKQFVRLTPFSKHLWKH
ncbi:hypothetical protein CDV31_016962 [Fusarium ambrosium]|uniref:Uncharacterized protein n=1 Tax=Fusarium ambrosium TaxID=131363 RepID=A0A428RX76_9HYPO|nr:hypothetical protein CDV31_016962 [Fusarium ambrosium]